MGVRASLWVDGCRSPRHRAWTTASPTLRDRPVRTRVGSAQSREANSSRDAGAALGQSFFGENLWDLGYDRMSLSPSFPPSMCGLKQNLGSRGSCSRR